MANKIELTPYKGIDVRGIEITHDQWNVLVNGRLVGYLCHDEGSRLMPIINLPDATWDEVCSKCEKLRIPPGKVERPFPIYVPPKIESNDDE